jgi:hypothetical protein
MDSIINKQIKIFKIANNTLKTPVVGIVKQLKSFAYDKTSYYLSGSWGLSLVDIEKDEYIIL